MKNLTKTLLQTCLVVTLIASTAGQSAIADVETYRNTLNCTSWVLAKSDGETSSGTGVLVDAEKKLMITNFHVVGDARSTVVFFPAMKNGKPIVERSHYLKNVKKLGVRGRVLAIDRKRDLALIELDRIPEGVTAIALADTEGESGESIMSIGNAGASEALWVHTSGTVRTVYQKQFRTGAGEHDFRVLETQSPINPGDSGGPVVNEAGQLIGISQSLSPKARLITYCVNITEIKALLESDWKPAPLPIAGVLKSAEMVFTEEKNDILRVDVTLKDDTKLPVFITKEVEYYEQADVRKIWALAATLKEAPSTETMMDLMQQSARTKIGSWSIEKDANGDFLVIYLSKIDATATPRAIKSTMEYVAKLTNLMKKDLEPATSKSAPADVLNDWLSN